MGGVCISTPTHASFLHSVRGITGAISAAAMALATASEEREQHVQARGV
jgi:hypothetical protein